MNRCLLLLTLLLALGISPALAAKPKPAKKPAPPKPAAVVAPEKVFLRYLWLAGESLGYRSRFSLNLTAEQPEEGKGGEARSFGSAPSAIESWTCSMT